MFDMNSLLATSVTAVKPPPDPSVVVFDVLNKLKEGGEYEMFQALINEEDPRSLFLYPSTLSRDEITIPFIQSHIMIPHEGDKARRIYKSADNSYTAEITVDAMIYTFTNHPPKKVKTIEKLTLYTQQFSTVQVLFIPFSIHNKEEDSYENCGEIIHPKTIPLKEYRSYSCQHARAVLEQCMDLLLASSSEDSSLVFSDFCFNLMEANNKFKEQLERFYHAEALRYQKNNIPSPSSFRCVEWAYKQVRLMQHQFLLSFMAMTNHGGSSILQFSNLYQPLEDIITSEAYSSIMLVLTHKSLPQESAFRSKLKEMRQNPLTHQPIEIMPSFRRLSLQEAASELKALESERGRTPLQKLICLKKTFVALESYLLEMSPPTKIAPQPPEKEKSFSRADLFKPKRKRTVTELEHSVPEYRRLAFEQWMTRKQHVMQLLLLLLIYHSPPNLIAHLEFILFHTINDEKYASLRIFYHMFRESITQLVQTSPRTKRSPTTTSETPNIRYYVYIWGIVDNQVESFPVLCTSLEGKQAVSIKCGDKHIIALANGGSVLTYGEGSEGQLGHGTEAETSSFVEVKLLNNLSVCAVGAGGSHSAAITRSGKLFCWGGNLWGQIGIGFTCESIPIPKQVDFSGTGSHVVVKVSCGAAHNLALMNDGRVWSWGMGANGRLGHGNVYDVTTPRRIDSLKDFSIQKISCGWSHSLCISSNNEVFSFGHGSDGQLGHGNLEDLTEPRKIEFNFGKIMDSSAFNHNLIASSQGLFTWGWGEHGELGLGDLQSESSPCLVDVQDHEIVTVSCGAFHSAATTKDGFILTWGLGVKGQLGHGDTNTQITPFALNYLYNHHIIEVSCGFSSTVAIQAAAEKTEYQVVK